MGSNSSSNSDDPDEYRGPGGLSGRQLFEQVRKSVERDTKHEEEFNRAASGGSSNNNTSSSNSRRYEEPFQQETFIHPDKKQQKSKESSSTSNNNNKSSQSSDMELPSDKPIEKWNIRQLQSLLQRNGLEYKDCLEKSDLIERAKFNGLDKTL